jgi:hypothetical protein
MAGQGLRWQGWYGQRNHGDGKIVDSDGDDLSDDVSAFLHGCRVVSEVMLHDEQRTRHWLLEVLGADGRVLFQLAFVEHDQTLAWFRPEWRNRIKHFCRLRRETEELFREARLTMLHSRALRARANGKPYLVADRGQSVGSPH